ncbi:lipopolysaccharide assembly protein LapA domain-containing protein [Azospirillum picis]|uniref:Integral membrane protein n=1 Tax=Azospirillum picis TaxID=488438 RepID=A0ABU0MKE8_9PROT|nr:LapA family protein [Azospirillum picis]MBP2299938.1 putative integral membrane protein [Azospirillum picis]MDQ0533824.1 putative integral membrane protein [Azospirillum picis]
MRHLSWIITIPVALVAILFAISNRGIVTLSLWPLPFTLEAPVYIATLVALLLGFLAGGFIVWNSQRRHRRRARREGNRVLYLERELKEAQARAAAAEKRLAETTRPLSGPAAGTLPGPSGTLPVPAAETQAPTVH